MTEEHSGDLMEQPSRLTLYSLAMVGGLGMTMMILAAAIGVIYGAALAAETAHNLGLLFVSGLLVFVAAIGFWLGWARPFEHFDDINVPAEPEHH